MPGCVLRVGTKTSDVDRAVDASGLRPLKVFRKGTPKFLGAPTLAKVSGFNVDVTPNVSLEGEVRAALEMRIETARHYSAARRAARRRSLAR